MMTERQIKNFKATYGFDPNAVEPPPDPKKIARATVGKKGSNDYGGETLEKPNQVEYHLAWSGIPFSEPDECSILLKLCPETGNLFITTTYQSLSSPDQIIAAAERIEDWAPFKEILDTSHNVKLLANQQQFWFDDQTAENVISGIEKWLTQNIPPYSPLGNQ